MDQGDVDPCLRGCAQGLVVLAQPSAPAQPGEGALQRPTAGPHLKLMAMRGPFHNFQCPAGPGPDPLDQLAGRAGIGPDLLQARTAPLQAVPDPLGTISVLHVCRMDHHGQEHAYGVHYDVALANPLPAGRRHSPRAPFFRGSHRLTVDDRGVGGRVSTLDGPHRRPPGLLDAAQVSSWVQPRKYLYTVCQGGRSCGRRRKAQPLRHTYNMPCSTSRRSTDRGRPPGLVAGNRGASSAHWASVKSLVYCCRVMPTQ